MTPERSDSHLLTAPVTRAVIGAFFDTYNELGPGFPEFITRQALAIVIRERGFEVLEETRVQVWFHGHRLAGFKVDLIVDRTVVVEVKVGTEIEPYHQAQLLHYLKATDLEVGLLVNFGRRPEFKRVIFENARKPRAYLPPVDSANDVTEGR
jgi:GxxExxY protein